MTQILISATILFASAFYWGPNYHGTRNYTFFLLGTAWLAWIAGRRVHWSVGLALGWVMFAALRVSAAPLSPYMPFGNGVVSTMDALTLSAVLSILLVTVPLLFAERSALLAVTRGFGWLCILDSIYVVAQWVHGNASVDRGGFFGNASMNACIIAITYPIWTRRKWDDRASEWRAFFCLLGLVLPLVAVAVSRSNMAVAAMCAALISPVFTGGTKVIGPLTLCAAVAIPGIYLMGPKFATSEGRTLIWRAAARWWWENGHGWGPHVLHWLGTGTGTFFMWGPNIQIRDLHMTGTFFYWMHCDWGQLLFETGFIGLALVSLMYGMAIWRARKIPWVVSALAAYAVTACGNFPVHLPVSGFLGAFLIVRAFGK